jgi:hypothetical protein
VGINDGSHAPAGPTHAGIESGSRRPMDERIHRQNGLPHSQAAS